MATSRSLLNSRPKGVGFAGRLGLNRTSLTGALGGLLVLSASPIPAFELRWDAPADRVSAELLDAPLQSVLEQIRFATGWEVAIEPGLQYPISTTFNGLKSGEALTRLLRQSSFALIQRTNAAARLLVFQTSMDYATKSVLPVDEGDRQAASQIDDEWVVTLKPGADADELARKLGAKIVGRIDKLGAYRFKFDDAEAAKAARTALDANDAVERVDANYAIERPAALQPMMHASGQLPQIKAASGNADGQLVVGLVDTAVQIPSGELAKFFLKPVSLAGEFQPAGNVPTHGTGMSSDILNGIAAMVGPGNTANLPSCPSTCSARATRHPRFNWGRGWWKRGTGGPP